MAKGFAVGMSIWLAAKVRFHSTFGQNYEEQSYHCDCDRKDPKSKT